MWVSEYTVPISTQNIKLQASRLDCNLQCLPTVHLVQGCLIVFQFEDVGNHALHLDLTAVKVCNGAREAICLGEGSDDLQQDFGQKRQRKNEGMHEP